MSLANKVISERLKRPYHLSNINNGTIQDKKNTRIKRDIGDDAYAIKGFDVLLNNRGFNIDRMTSEYYLNKDRNLNDLPRLIERYRELSKHSYVDEAIEIIVDEVIYTDTEDQIIELDLTKYTTEFKNEKLAEKIQKKFRKILDLMEFNDKAFEYMRDYYIDGRICFECVYDLDDKNKVSNKNGIIDITQIDPVFVEKYYEVDTESTLYKIRRINFDSYGENRVSYGRIHSDIYSNKGAIEEVLVDDYFLAYTDSGYKDRNMGISLSYLHRVMSPANQLKTLEDSILIYRLARAPERRVFFVDVGKASQTKAESFIRELKSDMSTKSIYGDDGTIDTSKAIHNILEDYWIPRRNGSNATDVSTIQGQNNLGELGDLSHFKEKVFRGLRVPQSRINGEGTYFYGNEGDITHDEVRFFKMIDRIRSNFSRVILLILRNELVNSGLFDETDWKKYKKYFKIRFSKSSHYAELMENKILEQRIDMFRKVAGDEITLLNTFYPEEWIWTKIFKYNDEEISEVKKLLKDKGIDLETQLRNVNGDGEDISLNDGMGGSGGSIGDEEFADEEFDITGDEEMSTDELEGELEDTEDIEEPEDTEEENTEI